MNLFPIIWFSILPVTCGFITIANFNSKVKQFPRNPPGQTDKHWSDKSSDFFTFDLRNTKNKLMIVIYF